VNGVPSGGVNDTPATLATNGKSTSSLPAIISQHDPLFICYSMWYVVAGMGGLPVVNLLNEKSLVGEPNFAVADALSLLMGSHVVMVLVSR
jgi:hypothetical protein